MDGKRTVEPDWETLFERAVHLAAEWHAGQRDKGGEAYLKHVLRVALMGSPTPPEMCLAVLHDVLEDAADEWQRGRRRARLFLMFGEDFVNYLELLSRKPGQDYAEYIAAIAPVAACRQVKLADIEDNLCDLRMMRTGFYPSPEIFERYHNAHRALSALEEAALFDAALPAGGCVEDEKLASGTQDEG